MTKQYRITLLPGDGIGPEIIAVAVDVLRLVGKKCDLEFDFEEALIGGAAIDATGEPLPEETLIPYLQSFGDFSRFEFSLSYYSSFFFYF